MFDTKRLTEVRIELQKLALDLERVECNAAASGDTTIPKPVVVNLKNLVREIENA